MDVVADPSVREIWVMKSAQIGWTEILGNVVGYHMHQDPATMLLIQPTLEMAEAWSKDRLAPMLRDTPALRALIKDPRSRDSGNTLLHKPFSGGALTVAGANSPASLASRPIRIVLCDEIDRYPISAGTEGDPIKLAQKRSATFWNRRFLAGSTPTVKGASRIEIGFAQSDQRSFFVPCPHCGGEQVFEWKRVKWPEGRPDDAFYACAHCDAALTDGDRVRMIASGQWRATTEGKPGIVGFHLWEAYSPWRRLSEIVSDFIAAKDHPELLKVWVNTSLGQCWEDPAAERMLADELAGRTEDYPLWSAPQPAALATAGVDVQHDRLEVGVYAWGPGEECWAVAHEVIYGNPADVRVWAQLDDLLAREVARDDGMQIPISSTVVDASDGTTTGFVLDYCRQRRRRNILAGKGASQQGKPPIGRPSKVDLNARGISVRRGAELWPIGTDGIKGVLMARLKEPGMVHFPDALPVSYFEQLTAERLATKWRNGVPYRIWVKDQNQRNEALDCLVYAFAAAVYAGLKRANWAAMRARLKPRTDAPQRPEAPPPASGSSPPKPAPRAARSFSRDGFGSSDWNL